MNDEKVKRIIKKVIPNKLSEPPEGYKFFQSGIEKIDTINQYKQGFTIAEFPSCCGACILHDFRVGSNQYGDTANTYKDLKRNLMTQVENARQRRFGMVLLILNHDQAHREYVKIVEELGFNLLFKTCNPNYQDQHVLHLFGLNTSSVDFEKDDKSYTKKLKMKHA